MKPFPSFGGAPYSPNSKKIIRLILMGCANRPFFHISVQEARLEPQEPVIEQLGNYDPLPNNHNEKLVAIDFHRLEHWLREGALLTNPVKKLLGLCGYFPVHPASMEDAFRRRLQLRNIIEELKIEAAKFTEESKSEAAAEEKSESEPSESNEPQSASNAEPLPNDTNDKDSKS